MARLTDILDTSVVIDALRQKPAALTFLGSLSSPAVCSEVTRVEVIQGLRHDERKNAEMLFGALNWVDIDEEIARRAGELGRTWRRSHPGIGIPDLIIAATAENLGLKLATLNVKHFPMFKGLRAPYRG